MWFEIFVLFVLLLIGFKLYLVITLGRYEIKETLNGKIVIVTGATSGIGKETALELARAGAKVYMAVRNTELGEQIAGEIRRETNNDQVFVIYVDLTKLETVRKFAEEFKRKEKQLHILINNAGMSGNRGSKPTLTADGLEETMAANHFGHFLLTNLLLDLIKSSAPARIVNVSSLMHSFAKFNVDDLNFKVGPYSSNQSYACSKLANVLFTNALAKRLWGTGVNVNALCPGFVSTDIFRKIPPGWRQFWMRYVVLAYLSKTPKQGAATTLYVATSPKVDHVTGVYFSDCKPKGTSLAAVDFQLAEDLWKKSEELVGLKKIN